MKKDVLENFPKFTGKHLWFAKLPKTPFLQNTPERLLLVLQTMFGKTQMNIHYLETQTLEVPFRDIISFSAA